MIIGGFIVLLNVGMDLVAHIHLGFIYKRWLSKIWKVKMRISNLKTLP